ncbi:SDR family oxidoreductase [Amycolatopsis nigrescens]|uniref:SDR family oxidoreductase n=1 Tax=Amycolatopsis nigrescens TaxID=381445 RepID=UPI0003817E64|nr:SDR family oxidoreductase [Amycolatopsis nigrescens]
MTLLVSGATGFLGTALLRKVDQPVVALLRGGDWANRAKTLQRRTGAQVRGVPGDVRRPNWGLPDELVAELRDEVDAVINLAGDVSWSAPWSRLVEINVEGATNSAELARKLGATLVHASSLYAGYDHGEEVYEVLLEERPKLTKYERTKLRGEWAVARIARAHGVPTVIARIPALSGDFEEVPGVRSGATKVPFSRIIQTGVWPVLPFASGARLDICPRDLVAAKMLSALAELPDPPPDVVVRNIGQGAAAPLVEAFAKEAAAATHGDTRLFPRPVRMPAKWLRAVSQQADRLDESPKNSAVIGLRYFASKTVFSSSGLDTDVSVRSLVRTLGMPHRPQAPVLDSYYAGWPA